MVMWYASKLQIPPHYDWLQAKKVFGRKGELVVISSLIVTQFGFCCVYTLFIAEHLEQVCMLCVVTTH